ncbi:MAG: glycosyltransferase, partial [Planctomycetota bacterium]
MRVLLDGYNLGLERGTGVATYALGLSRLLRDAGHGVEVLYGRAVQRSADPLQRQVEFFDREGDPPHRSRVARWRRGLRGVWRAAAWRRARPQWVPIDGAVVTDPLRGRLPEADRLWNHPEVFDAARLRHRLTGGFFTVSNAEIGADVAHWTYPLPLRLEGAANVYTVHDLVPLRMPYATLDRKATHLRMLRQIVRDADLIVTVSEASRRDLIELLGVDEARVVNTYQPTTLPEALLDTSEDELAAALRGVFGLERGEYLLAYGAVEPKKNFGRLIEAYLGSSVTMPLVIA